LLAVAGLHAGYGATEILRGVDLTVHSGEIVAVLGTNGAGKSTLNRAISGVIRPWRGTIRFNGAAIERERPAHIVAQGLIHVPEGRRIFANMTVRENLDSPWTKNFEGAPLPDHARRTGAAGAVGIGRPPRPSRYGGRVARRNGV
jgi:ABC-type branched-subunit amino acid transport system ATPase component